jgi:stage II sporulation protein E
LSGDSYTTVELANGGKFAVAISDGMGNGERAKQESRSALTILEQLLKSGMDETLAIKSVNSILNLRSSDDVYATVDVALVDLYNADTTFMKIGSMPSYIKRGLSIIPICANNLPIGILNEIDVDLIRLQLQADDLLIMMTDGVFGTNGYDSERERWIMRCISEIQVEDTQCFADMLLEKVMRSNGGSIDDDMTVVVTRIQRHHAPWASFRWSTMADEEPARIVS